MFKKVVEIQYRWADNSMSELLRFPHEVVGHHASFDINNKSLAWPAFGPPVGPSTKSSLADPWRSSSYLIVYTTSSCTCQCRGFFVACCRVVVWGLRIGFSRVDSDLCRRVTSGCTPSRHCFDTSRESSGRDLYQEPHTSARLACIGVVLLLPWGLSRPLLIYSHL